MTNPDRPGNDPVDREVVRRVLRRLDVLESMILGAAAILALLGGALVAWLLSASLGLSFRISWFVASLLLFVVPGAIAYARDRLGGVPGTDDDVTTRTGGRDG